jgi:hypothetical protein
MQFISLKSIPVVYFSNPIPFGILGKSAVIFLGTPIIVHVAIMALAPRIALQKRESEVFSD